MKKNKKNNYVYVFCYGTLMSYNPNSIMYGLEAERIDTVEIDDYQLYLVYGTFLFPAIVKGHGAGKKLYAQVWKVDKSSLYYIDNYEGISSGLYSRDEITVGQYTGFIYRMNKVSDGMTPIKCNDWLKFYKPIEYTLVEDYRQVSGDLDTWTEKLERQKKKSSDKKKIDYFINLYNKALERYWAVRDKVKDHCSQ